MNDCPKCGAWEVGEDHVCPACPKCKDQGEVVEFPPNYPPGTRKVRFCECEAGRMKEARLRAIAEKHV